jgi:dihydroflavonol-4-reductase
VPDVFLTGGTGYVGGVILDALVAGGRRVRALVRDGRGADHVLAAGAAEAVRGDVLDRESLVGAIDGCRAVFHAAGVNSLCAADPAAMHRTNVVGSRNVIVAAADAGVERVVYTSSAATIGEPRGVTATEATPHRRSFNTDYERSKYDAERVVLTTAERFGVDVVAVNPSSVQGPGRTGGTARLLIGFLTGRLRYAVDVPLSLVSGADCAAAHVLAERHGARGERYLVSGVTLTVGEAVDLLGRITGETRRVRMVPAWVVRAAAAPVGPVFRVFGRDAPICREAARAMLHGHRYDGSRAERDLGLAYTPAEEWMAETVAWYREQGLA